MNTLAATRTPQTQPAEANNDFQQFLSAYGIELSPQQQRAAATVYGPTLLTAVPGSGKTTTLTARLGYMIRRCGINPSRICALTFTNAAANDMKKRFIELFDSNGTNDGEGITFATINSLASRIYHYECKKVKGTSPRNVADAKTIYGIAREILKPSAEEKKDSPSPSESEIKEALTLISKIKNELVVNDRRRRSNWSDGDLALLDAYERKMRERNVIDFDDQLVFAFDIIRKGEETARHFREKYQYWSIDEAQDCSRLQHALLYLLSGKAGNLFMVGDEDQSIYGFRGASPSLMLGFDTRYANPLTLKMEINYRSGKSIVRAADAFAKRMDNRIDKNMVAARSDEGAIKIIDVTSEGNRSKTITDILKDSPSATVLFRDNDSAIPLVDTLLRSNVPFSVKKRDKVAFFSEKTVEDATAFLNLSLNPRDVESFKQIYYKANCYVGKDEADRAIRSSKKSGRPITDELIAIYSKNSKGDNRASAGQNLANLIKAVAKARMPKDAIATLLSKGYGNYLREKSISDSKVKILECLAAKERTVPGFLRRLEELAQEIENHVGEPAPGAATVTTCHASKGLEFDTVIIADAYDGHFPSTKKTDVSPEEQLQEERRLFYVAMTRAKNQLYLLRTAGEKTSFIDEVSLTETGQDNPASPAKARPSLESLTTDYQGSKPTEIDFGKPIGKEMW